MVGLLAAAFGIAVALVADIGFSRGGVGRVATYGISLLAGLVAATAVLLIARQAGNPGTVLIATAAYICWWFIFLNLVQGVESSIRARLIREVSAAGRNMPKTELLSRYNNDMLLSYRRERLVAGGVLFRENGRLRIAPSRLSLIASIFTTLKVILLGRRSEFDEVQK